MRKTIYLSALLIVLSIKFSNLNAQGSFSQVYQLLQSKCSNAGCHDGSLPLFNVMLSEPDFYNSIINAKPSNRTAQQKLNKLVVPGDISRSFLLRKIAHGISDGLALTQPDEGADEPNGLPKLADNEIELVRQWILFGAPLTGNVVDTALINTYYRDGGIDETYTPHEPPLPSEGFQIYVGKIFIAPNTEKEYFLKFDPHLTAPVEGVRVVTMMPGFMHHFVLYSFKDGGDLNYHQGLRPLSESSMENVYNAIGTASGLWDYSLPPGTAYFFNQGLIFDVNTHCINTQSAIVAADIYINVYIEPVGTAQDYMRIRNFANKSISIPMDGQLHTFTHAAYDSSETNTWKLWKLFTHSHKYGKKFDVFLRNPDGSKGKKIYDGNYSYEGGFDTGYYRWGIDVTFRTWADDSLFTVDPRFGFIYEATYKNTGGPDPVTAGMTSNDEMMVMGFHYIYGSELSTGVRKVERDGLSMNILPNPSCNRFMLSYKMEHAQSLQVELFNLLGEKVAVLINRLQQEGTHTETFRTDDFGLHAGVYFLTIRAGDKTSTEKLIITN